MDDKYVRHKKYHKREIQQAVQLPTLQGRQGGGTLETPLHLMQCEAYLIFRQGSNPEEDFTDRAVYLRKVIAKRKELEVKLKIKD